LERDYGAEKSSASWMGLAMQLVDFLIITSAFDMCEL